MGTQLFEENKQLRELIASLGGDSSSVPSSSLSSISPLSLNTSKTAKRVKRECRVDLPANSLESEATQNPSQQLEPRTHQLAVATTALLLTLLSASRSVMTGATPKPQDPQLMTSTSLESTPRSSSECVPSSTRTEGPSKLLIGQTTSSLSIQRSPQTSRSTSWGLCLTADPTNVLRPQSQALVS